MVQDGSIFLSQCVQQGKQSQQSCLFPSCLMTLTHPSSILHMAIHSTHSTCFFPPTHPTTVFAWSHWFSRPLLWTSIFTLRSGFLPKPFVRFIPVYFGSDRDSICLEGPRKHSVPLWTPSRRGYIGLYSTCPFPFHHDQVFRLPAFVLMGGWLVY
jgi:hypothetical protein